MAAAPELCSRARVLGIGGASFAELLTSDRTKNLWDFDVVPDLRSAAEKLRSTSYDVVVVDLSEPSLQVEMDVIEQLRDIRPAADVILLVEQSTPQRVMDAIRAHAFGYFSKPFDYAAVREMILNAAAVQEPDDSIQLMSATASYLSLLMRCSVSTADRIVQFMREIPIELPADDRNEVATAFREVLLNAIEHGGKLDSNEWVRVSRIRTQRTLVYHVLDPGEGFSRDRLEHAALGCSDDPIAHAVIREQAGMRPGGFGMLIVSRLVDEVIYNQQGNEVLLIKYLT